jgi:ethanolamine utilization protein EutN
MYIARVIGNVVATIKHPAFEGRKLMLVQQIGPLGKPMSTYDITVDTMQAGIGDTVLILDEGSGARQILGGGELPIRAVIVGIIDDVEVYKE